MILVTTHKPPRCCYFPRQKFGTHGCTEETGKEEDQ